MKIIDEEAKIMMKHQTIILVEITTLFDPDGTLLIVVAVVVTVVDMTSKLLIE